MKRRIISLGLLAVLMAAGPARAQEAEGPELRIDDLDQSDFPSVVLTVTVPAEMNGLDLLPGNFFVAEGDQPVAVQVEQLPAAELQVALVMDISGSMAGEPIRSAKAAVTGFVEAMPPDVELALIRFGDIAELMVPFTVERDPIISGIDGLVANDNATALYDGLLEAVASFGDPEGKRRTIVLLTDGADSGRGAELDDALVGLIGSGARLLIVELDSPQVDRTTLSRLEAATGGTLVAASDPDALEGIYDEVASDLINQYRLRFESSADGPTELVIAVRTADITAQGVTAARFPVAPPVTESSVTSTAAPATTEAPTAVAVPAPVPVEVNVPWIATTPGLMLGASAVFIAATLLLLLLVPTRQSALAALGTLGGMAGRVQNPGKLSALTNKATLFAEEAIRRGRAESGLRLKLDQAGLKLREGEFLLLVFAAALVAVVAAWLFAGVFAAVAAGGLIALLAWSLLGSIGTRRANKFRAQLPDSLQLITGSLRAGFGLNQAITAVANELDSPAGEEYARVQLEVHLGREVEDALRSMARRVQSEDLPWVAEAIEIHREIGGDVADLLDQIAGTVRERERVRGQIQVLSAEGRISGVVLVALPFGIAGITLLTSPDYLTELTSSTVGQIMLAGGAVAMIMGIFWIRRIVRLEF